MCKLQLQIIIEIMSRGAKLATRSGSLAYLHPPVLMQTALAVLYQTPLGRSCSGSPFLWKEKVQLPYRPMPVWLLQSLVIYYIDSGAVAALGGVYCTIMPEM